MYIPALTSVILSISVSIILLQISNSSGAVIHPPARRPNLYKWLAQNSYICDPTLLNKRSHRFLAPRESVRSRCSCGDPIVTKAACGRRNGTRDKPKCFRLPDSCLREYSIIFANGGDRLTMKPHTRRRPHPLQRTTITTHRRRTTTMAPKVVVRKPKHRMPKIVSTVPVTTILRVRKQRKPQ